MTDAYVLTGILDPDHFAGGIRLRPDLAEAALARLGEKLSLSARQAASAVLQVATANMYAQLMLLLARKGVDHREFALIAYGGAGPTHAMLLAREAGIPRVVVPPSPGTVCALGALVADIRTDLIETIYADTQDVSIERLEASYARLAKEGLAWLEQQHVPVESTELRRSADIRYKGQSFNLTVALPEHFEQGMASLHAAYHEAYRRIYGYADVNSPVEIINIRLTVVGRLPVPDVVPKLAGTTLAQPTGRRAVRLDDQDLVADVYDRPSLIAGQVLPGPVVIEATDTTIFVPPGYTARTTDRGIIFVEENGHGD